MPILNNFLKNIQDLYQGFSTSEILRGKNPRDKKSKIKKPTGGHSGGAKLWRSITFFGAIPIVVLLLAKTFMDVSHHEHERQEYIPYPHLRIRNKRFPWGDGQRSLFHNKKFNPLPGIGYED